MSIIYALVARGKDATLVEYTMSSGTFPLIARTLLNSIEADAQRFIQYNDKYVFHYVNADDFTYMCLTEASFSKKNSLAFLLALKERFLSTFSYDQRIAAINYSLNNAFSDTIKKLMNQFSNDLEDDGLAKLKSNIGELKNYLQTNIDTLIDRQDRIELLVRTTSTMSATAQNIRKQAGQLRRETYWRSIRVKVMIGAAAALGTLGFIALV